MSVPIIILIAALVLILLVVLFVVIKTSKRNSRSGISYANMGPNSKSSGIGSKKSRHSSYLSRSVNNDPSQINIGKSREVSSIQVPKHSSKAYSGRVELDSAKSVSASSNSFLKNRFLGFYIALGAGIAALLGKSFFFQVFNWSKYEKQSDDNMFTTISTPAPRGKIFDCNGIELANSQNDIYVMAKSETINNRDVMLRLSAVLGIPLNIVRQRLLDTAAGSKNDRISI
ncbi:MAG: hypothetical protein HUJ63_04265 [Enterococcus sp.]|nr:hypothetical protein [Enterococcus sp.]